MKTTKENRLVIYKGVVITKQKDGTWIWFRNPMTLEECKKEIDKEFKGSPPLKTFAI